jgi:class 3 adenylate cyclase
MQKPINQKTQPVRTLNREYEDVLAASGLIDDLVDVAFLDPRPYRYAEGDFLCERGEPADCLWIIVSGSIAVKEKNHTLFVRRQNDIVGEQALLGSESLRIYDLVAHERTVEVLIIQRANIEKHPQKEVLWRNIAKIVSFKLRKASAKIESLSRQLEDDTRILQAYTNKFALSRRFGSGATQLTDYMVERVIMWFSDVVNFSGSIVNLSPEQTAEIVQRFFDAQTGPITDHGGHIDKFIGDGLMAFWVLPANDGPTSVKCLDALRAAEEAKQNVSQIRIGNHALRLRIGLHIGTVLSGDFGSATRHQFTIIGPEVNKAARLEEIHDEDVVAGSSEVGDVRVSSEFHHELSDTVRERYPRKSTVIAKNIGQIDVYS